MTGKINGKTPDEIKGELEGCKDKRFCAVCDLERQCRIKTNALDLIHQLEREKDDAWKAGYDVGLQAGKSFAQ